MIVLLASLLLLQDARPPKPREMRPLVAVVETHEKATGSTACEVLVTMLSESEQVRILERTYVAGVIAESKLELPRDAAKLGKLLNAAFVILPLVNSYEAKDGSAKCAVEITVVAAGKGEAIFAKTGKGSAAARESILVGTCVRAAIDTILGGVLDALQDASPHRRPAVPKEARIVIGVLTLADKADASITDAASAVIAELNSSEQFRVIDRSKIAAVLAELKLAEAADPATAAVVGKLCNLKYVVYGAVTSYAMKPGEKDGKKLRTAAVTVTLRTVDVATSEVVYSATHEGTATMDAGTKPDALAEAAIRAAVRTKLDDFLDSMKPVLTCAGCKAEFLTSTLCGTCASCSKCCACKK